jgi:hypothetical protein
MLRQHQLLVAVLFLLPATLPAQAVNNCKAADLVSPAPCNGISVGEPRVFDNRTLTLMLESLSATLQSQQNQSLDRCVDPIWPS